MICCAIQDKLLLLLSLLPVYRANSGQLGAGNYGHSLGDGNEHTIKSCKRVITYIKLLSQAQDGHEHQFIIKG